MRFENIWNFAWLKQKILNINLQKKFLQKITAKSSTWDETDNKLLAFDSMFYSCHCVAKALKQLRMAYVSIYLTISQRNKNAQPLLSRNDIVICIYHWETWCILTELTVFGIGIIWVFKRLININVNGWKLFQKLFHLIKFCVQPKSLFNDHIDFRRLWYNIEIGYHYSSLYKWDTYVHLDESNTTFSLSCTLETPGL